MPSLGWRWRGRRLAGTLALAAVLTAAIALAPAGEAGRFTFAATVVRVVDGDTLDVRLASGLRARVRVLGIDAPERGRCFGAASTARARALAPAGLRVALVGDRTQPTRDRFGRLLAYVRGGGGDVGRALLATGHARVYVVRRPFLRVASYRASERAARDAFRGLWGACLASQTEPPPPAASPPPPPPPPPLPADPPLPPEPPMPLAACADLLDNDADGLVDFPADLECASPADTDETTGHEPPPPGS